MTQFINILIVDDSARIRKALTDILTADPLIRIMATASDPFVAASKMKIQVPDVISLDVEMPRMDGITFLQKIMTQYPIPVVMCSHFAGTGTDIAMKAMEYGAVDIIEKPGLGPEGITEETRTRIIKTFKAAARTRLSSVTQMRHIAPKLTADAVLAKPIPGRKRFDPTAKIVVVGASTGGTEALVSMLREMPLNCPGIVVVQHMPQHFTRSFAQRLDEVCTVSVREAASNDTVLPGQVLIAPGNQHLLLKRSGSRYVVEVRDGPLVSRHRPSVDVLFRSAARCAGPNAIGVMLTGMGDDGATGMQEMKETGAFNIAQDEESCVVFGMPKEAIKNGAVDKILPLDCIAREVLRQAAAP